LDDFPTSGYHNKFFRIFQACLELSDLERVTVTSKTGINVVRLTAHDEKNVDPSDTYLSYHCRLSLFFLPPLRLEERLELPNECECRDPRFGHPDDPPPSCDARFSLEVPADP